MDRTTNGGDDGGSRTCTPNLGYAFGTKTVFDGATSYRIPVTGLTGRWYSSAITSRADAQLQTACTVYSVRRAALNFRQILVTFFLFFFFFVTLFDIPNDTSIPLRYLHETRTVIIYTIPLVMQWCTWTANVVPITAYDGYCT